MGFRMAIGVLALTAVSSTSVLAQSFYAGLGVGQSNTKFNSSDYSLATPGINESQDKSDTAWKGFAGYNFTRNFGIEGGYADFGKPAYQYSAPGLTGQAEVKNSAWFLAATATLPLNDSFELFGKLGASVNKSKLTISSNNAALNAAEGWPASDSKNKTDVLYGIGGQFNITKQIGLRLEYENFGKFGSDDKTGRTKTDLWSLGLVLKF